MTESERLKLHIWSLHESRDGPAMAELRHMIAGMVTHGDGAGQWVPVASMDDVRNAVSSASVWHITGDPEKWMRRHYHPRGYTAP